MKRRFLIATHCGKMYALMRMIGVLDGKCEELSDLTYNTPYKNCGYVEVNASILYGWLAEQANITGLNINPTLLENIEFVFVRHGQSQYNVLTEEEVAQLMKGVANGDPNSKTLLINPRLTNIGEQQAKESPLCDEKWCALNVASSPYIRAQQTAELISGHTVVNLIDGLKEIDLSNPETTFESVKADCVNAVAELLLMI